MLNIETKCVFCGNDSYLFGLCLFHFASFVRERAQVAFYPLFCDACGKHDGFTESSPYNDAMEGWMHHCENLACEEHVIAALKEDARLSDEILQWDEFTWNDHMNEEFLLESTPREREEEALFYQYEF